jgi:hypothetical protein
LTYKTKIPILSPTKSKFLSKKFHTFSHKKEVLIKG